MTKEFKDSRFFLWLAVIGVIGCALILLITRKWGLGVTTGSMSYVEAARNFVSGSGFSIFSNRGTLEPLVSYPPGFPFVLSWGWFLGLDAFHWARLLNSFFFGVNIFLAGILAWSWSRNKIAGLVASGLFLFSPELLKIHVHLLSEPIFFTLLLLFFIALSRYEDHGGKKMFYALACSAALAGLIKPAEMAFIVTAWAVFFSAKGEALKEKAVKAGFFLLIAVSFSVIWGVRHVFSGGSVWEAYSFSVVRFGIGLAFAVAIALWWLKKKPAGQDEASVTGIRTAFLFMLVSCTVFLFVMSFADPAMMAGNGDLSSALALVLIVLACMVVRVDLKKIFLGMFILFALVSIGRSVALAVSFIRDGDGYSSKAWTESKVLRELRAVDERVTVYANDPAAVYYLIGRPAIQIPALQEDDRFFPTVSAASRMFEARAAVGVVFNEKFFSSGSRWTALKRAAALKNVMSDNLASIYVQKKAAAAEKAAPKAVRLEK